MESTETVEFEVSEMGGEEDMSTTIHEVDMSTTGEEVKSRMF